MFDAVTEAPRSATGLRIAAGNDTLGLRALTHLLRSYERVLNARPLQIGNLEFLLDLLESARVLAEALLERASPAERANLGLDRIAGLVAGQTAPTSAEAAGAIVTLLDDALEELERVRLADLVLQSPLPELDADYDAVHVVFGCGIGLGDELTYYRFLRRLARHTSPRRLTVHTLYCNVWRSLIPGVREVSYRKRPLRPFEQVAHPGDGPELVVVADFEFYDIGGRVVPRRDERDVLEISLGECGAWLRRAGSDWTTNERFPPRPFKSYYAFLTALGDRLFGEADSPAWAPVVPPTQGPRAATERLVVVNPLSSKPLPLEPDDWARVLTGVHARLPGRRLRARVYPGLHPVNREFTERLCRLASRRSPGLAAGLLDPPDRELSPWLALPALREALEPADLCLTLDTFTAHFAPLLGVPTVVVAYLENREFWVPSPWVFYVVLRDVQQTVPPLVSYLLHGGQASVAARELVLATDAALPEGLNEESTGLITSRLAAVLPRLRPRFPYGVDGRRWLRLWSRLERAVQKEPPDQQALLHYLARWQQSEFFKLVALPVRVEAG